MLNLAYSQDPKSTRDTGCAFPRRTLVVVGGGFSGTMVTVQLLMRWPEDPIRIVLIERAGNFGQGVAYRTRSASHLLNVPAGRMSALPDQPDHFLNWAKRRKLAIEAHTFAPRALYGEYLRDLLEQAIANCGRRISIARMVDEAVDIKPPGADGRHVVVLRSGRTVAGDKIVLALGNFQPADTLIEDMTFYDSPQYIRDPWAIGALAPIKPDEPVMIVGTGLTMIDIALELRERGHNAAVHAVSRRGLLPQPHRSPSRPPAYRFHEQNVEGWKRSALGLLRQVRREVGIAEAAGDDWREVINALRPFTQKLWNSLGHAERSRFLRHLRPIWDVHRHRAASEPAMAIQSMISAGRLVVHRARICSLRRHGETVEASVRPRGCDRIDRIHVKYVINASGPQTGLDQVRDPLMMALRARGMICPDPLGLGLRATDDGTIIAAGGEKNPALRVVGPLRRGDLWENTAVPELRVEAATLAETLLAEWLVPDAEMAL